MTPVFIALGANLADPLHQITRAVAALRQLPHCQRVICSPLYASTPMGPADQPDYVNGVAWLETSLSPHQLLNATQDIELTQGRVRKAERWGPRTLDLDLLLYGNLTMHDERLTVPHYGMRERSFVLQPLFDLVPDLVLPDGTPLRELIAACDCSGLRPLPDRL